MNTRIRSAIPPTTRSIERVWQANCCALVAGVDEVGRGPLAGPVVAAAVILPHDDPDWLPELRDSKLLTPLQRERLAELLRREALAVGVGVVPARRIDEAGIAPASREAMRLAVLRLSPAPQALLLDAFALPEVALPQQAIIRGDAICSAIAAASIVAKVARDRIMAALDRKHPGYGFARNRGYSTAEHLDALQRLGPSPIHRYSFAPVAACGRGSRQSAVGSRGLAAPSRAALHGGYAGTREEVGIDQLGAGADSCLVRSRRKRVDEP